MKSLVKIEIRCPRHERPTKDCAGCQLTAQFQAEADTLRTRRANLFARIREAVRMKTVAIVGFPMRVISLWQPWAELVARGLKQYETRGWAIDYRGPIAIHAAKKKYRPDDYPQDFRTQMLMDEVDSYWLQYGVVLCVVDIVSCEPTERIVRNLSLREQLYGDYGAGRFGWKLAHVRRFPKAIELAGHQGIFHWPEGEAHLRALQTSAEAVHA